MHWLELSGGGKWKLMVRGVGDGREVIPSTLQGQSAVPFRAAAGTLLTVSNPQSPHLHPSTQVSPHPHPSTQVSSLLHLSTQVSPHYTLLRRGTPTYTLARR